MQPGSPLQTRNSGLSSSRKRRRAIRTDRSSWAALGIGSGGTSLMGIYARWVLRWLIDRAMQCPEATRYREALIPQARGCVLEIGIGSGLNFPFYPPAVERIVGLDPSSELLR